MNKDELTGLIRNPLVLGMAIFVLNIPLGWILIAILTITNIENGFLSSAGGLIAASIIGGVHAALVKEPIHVKTKIIAVICYSIVGFATSLMVPAALGLPLNVGIFAINATLSIIYAVAIYVFIGIGEKGFLRTAVQKKLK